MSAKLMPAASTRMRTSSPPGSGSGASRTWRTSGAPLRVIQTCRMGPPFGGSGDAELAVARREQRVVARRGAQMLELRVAQRPRDSRRRAERQVARRDLRAGREQRAGADHAVVAHLAAVKYNRPDADQH